MKKIHRAWSLTWPMSPLIVATLFFTPWSQHGVVRDASAKITISLFNKPVFSTTVPRETLLRETRTDDYRLAANRCQFLVGFVLQKQWQLFALLLSGLCVWRSGWPLAYDNEYKGWRPWKSLLISFAIGVFVVFVYQEVWPLVTGHSFAIHDSDVTKDRYAYRFATLAMVNVYYWTLAPLCEELIFRGWLQRTASIVMNPWIALFAQAVIFGVLHHYQGVPGVIQTTLLGGIAGLLYLKTGRLWTSVLVHVLANYFGSFPVIFG